MLTVKQLGRSLTCVLLPSAIALSSCSQSKQPNSVAPTQATPSSHPALAQFKQTPEPVLEISIEKLKGKDLCTELQRQLPFYNPNIPDLQKSESEDSQGQPKATPQPTLKLSLQGAYLAKCNLSSRDLAGANLADADLTGANLNSTSLYNANLERANLEKATLNAANLSNVNANKTNFSEASLSAAYIFDGSFQEANFQNANLERAALLRGDLSKSNFKKANLQNVVLDLDKTQGTSFLNANLSRARWGTLYSGYPRTIRGADFSGADLSTANLQGIGIIGSNFTNANLEKVNFEGTVVYNTNFTNANLSNTNLKDAVFVGNALTAEQIKTAAFLPGLAGDSVLDNFRSSNKISQDQVREKIFRPYYGITASADYNTTFNPTAFNNKDIEAITPGISYIINHEYERKPN